MIKKVLITVALVMLSVLISSSSLMMNSPGFSDITPPWERQTNGTLLYKMEIAYNNSLYVVYTVDSRIPQSFYTVFKDGKWSKPVFAGGVHPSLGVGETGVVIASSWKGHMFIMYRIGDVWKSVSFNGTLATVSDVYVGDEVMVAWRGNQSLWISYFSSGHFQKPIKVADEKYPIRSIDILSPAKIAVSEEGLNEWLNVTYEKTVYGWEQVYSSVIRKKSLALTSTQSSFEGRAVTSATRGEAMWTYMVYMDEDNSLAGYGFNGDVQEMIQGYNSSAAGKVNIIVLDDGANNGDTKLYYVTNAGAQDISASASSWLSSEMDMGDPATLINFVVWVEKNYPAKYYFLDLWDHGGDYSGAMIDETSNDLLTLSDLRYAANQILLKTGRPIDIWGYDACLMNAGADNYQIKQGANIIVASEHTEGGDGWDYVALISNLTGNPYQTPEQYAYSHVVHVDDAYLRSVIVTMAAINTTAWDYGFMVAYNQLAQAIRQKAGTNNSDIKKAFNNTVRADATYWSTGIDVGDFAKQLLVYVKDPEIDYWANRLLENVSKAVINSYDTDTSGRKIVMAETMSVNEVNPSFYIFRETEWDEMLKQVFVNGTDDLNQPPVCNITSPSSGGVYSNDSVLELTGTAGDPDGSVQRVEIKIDRGDWITVNGTNVWNYTLSLSNLSFGTHTVFARSYDGDFYSIPARITFTVKPIYPDLVVTNISLNNTSPVAGDLVRINASVENIGVLNASSVNVSFYYDSVSPATLIGTINFGNISVNQTVNGSVVWNTTFLGGNRTIIVYADSTHSILEINENNNIDEVDVYVNGNPPSPPQNVTAKSGDSEVIISWDKPFYPGDAPVESYRIYRGTVSGGEVYIATVQYTTGYIDYDVSNGVTYYYYITAVNNVGESNRSVEVSVTPAGAPSPPQSLTLFRGDGYVVLSWLPPQTDNGAAITEYRIYRNGTLIANVTYSTYNFTDTGLNVSLNYTYYVTAVNSAGESVPSNEVNVSWSVPSAPQSVSALHYGDYVLLKWTPPSDNGGTHIIRYRVYRNGVCIANLSANLTEYVDKNISDYSVPYSYTVSAVNSVGESSESNSTVISWKEPGMVSNLTYSQYGEKITIKWDPPADTGGFSSIVYVVYIDGRIVARTNDTHLTLTIPAGLFSTKHKIAVVAQNPIGESEPANIYFESPINYLLWISVAGAVVAGVAVIVIIMKKRTKRA